MYYAVKTEQFEFVGFHEDDGYTNEVFHVKGSPTMEVHIHKSEIQDICLLPSAGSGDFPILVAAGDREMRNFMNRIMKQSVLMHEPAMIIHTEGKLRSGEFSDDDCLVARDVKEASRMINILAKEKRAPILLYSTGSYAHYVEDVRSIIEESIVPVGFYFERT